MFRCARAFAPAERMGRIWLGMVHEKFLLVPMPKREDHRCTSFPHCDHNTDSSAMNMKLTAKSKSKTCRLQGCCMLACRKAVTDLMPVSTSAHAHRLTSHSPQTTAFTPYSAHQLSLLSSQCAADPAQMQQVWMFLPASEAQSSICLRLYNPPLSQHLAEHAGVLSYGFQVRNLTALSLHLCTARRG